MLFHHRGKISNKRHMERAAVFPPPFRQPPTMEAEEFQSLGSLPGFLCALALQEPAAFPLRADLCTKNHRLVITAMWKIQLIWEEDLGTGRSLKGTQRVRVPRTGCALLSLLLHAVLCCMKINLLAPGERCWHHRALLPQPGTDRVVRAGIELQGGDVLLMKECSHP